MTLPRPGASRVDNLVATMLKHGNASRTLDLPRIAQAQGFDLADLTATFARMETALSLTPVACVEDE
jgi:hypothetical protein